MWRAGIRLGPCEGRASSVTTWLDTGRNAHDSEEEAVGAGRSGARLGDARGQRLRADHHRHRGRHREGRPGGRHPRRDGRAHQRNEGHQVGARRHQRDRRLRVPERHARTPTPSKSRWRGSRRCERSGVAVSGGDRVAHPALRRSKSGGARRDRQRHRGSRRSCSRRAASGRSPSRPRRSRTCRSATRNFTSLTAFVAGRRAERRVGRRHAPRRRRPEQHHDGRHLGDGHRQQRPDAQHEHRVDRRGQDPHAGLPGRVRPVERPADHRRHQERHEPVPRLGLRHPDQLGLEREQLGQRARTAIAKPKTSRPRRSATPSAARSASRAATTSCSSSTRTNTVRRRRRSTAATRSASACRRRSSAPATSRRRVDNNGALFNLIKDPSSSLPCTAANTAGCFQDGGVLGTDSGEPSLRDRASRSSAATRCRTSRQGAGPELQLRDCRRRRRTT